MTVCYVRLMPGFLMIPCFMVVGSGSMMFCGVLMMLGGLSMMLCTLFRHVSPLFLRPGIRGWCEHRETPRILTIACFNGITGT
jgi:hypothetical protein